MNQAFDLTSLTEDLKGRPEYKQLAQLITRYQSASSHQLDLQSALSSLRYIQSLPAVDGGTRTVVGQALLTHAVMYYCRSAIEDGSGRFAMGVTKGYSREQLVNHQNVVLLRNKAMAHFGVRAGTYGADWITEKVILKVVDAQGTVAMAWSRKNYMARLVFDLTDLCETALVTVENAAVERRMELANIVLKLAATDQDFRKVLGKHPFDPSAFYASASGASSFWRPGSQQHETHIPKDVTATTDVVRGPPSSTQL